MATRKETRTAKPSAASKPRSAKKPPRPCVRRGDAVVPVIELRELQDRDDLIVEELLQWVSGGETMASYCRLPGRPDRRSVMRWIADDPVLRQRYDVARAVGFDEIAEDMLRIADEDIPRDDFGKADNAIVQHRKLMIETRAKLLACWHPTRYSERVVVAGDATNPIQHNHTHQLTNEDRAARIEQILAKGRARAALAEANRKEPSPPAKDAEFRVSEPEPVREPEPDPREVPQLWIDLAVARGAARGHLPRTPEVVGVAFGEREVAIAGRVGNAIVWLQETPHGRHAVEWITAVTLTTPLVVDVATEHGRQMAEQLRARRMNVVEVQADELRLQLRAMLDPQASVQLSLPEECRRCGPTYQLAIAATLAEVAAPNEHASRQSAGAPTPDGASTA